MGRRSWSLRCFTDIKRFAFTSPPALNAPVPHPKLSRISSLKIWSCRASEKHSRRNINVLSLQQPGAAPNHSKTPSTSSGLCSKLAQGTRISQTGTRGLGNFNISFPFTSNFQCLCSVELLRSVRAEQMSFLMDLLNHKNHLENCI